MSDLVLHVKDVYFLQVRDGLKPEEYRQDTEYWRKRLIGRKYERIIYMSGYPKMTDTDKVLIRPYRGYVMKTITHEHFGNVPERVFAIDVRGSV